MAITKEIREALDLKNLDVPPALKVQSLEVEEYEDWFGDPSLRITVIIDDSVDEFKISGDDVIRLNRSIYDKLQARGNTHCFIFLSIIPVAPLLAASTHNLQYGKYSGALLITIRCDRHAYHSPAAP